ncbi:PEP-CTERM sorting domain-containing protein [Roseisolibacter agri]|nr:PEP-CTERM sorting domain-containing protein [Roseisolibacter agri]
MFVTNHDPRRAPDGSAARTPLVPRALAAAAAVALLLPAPAHALPGALDLCGGNSYTVCVRLSDWTFGTGTGAGGNGLGTDQLRFTLANGTAAAYAPATVTTFLIAGLGSAYDVASVSASSGGPYVGVSSGTAPNADNGFAGVGYATSPQPSFVGFDNGGVTGLAAGQAATLTFTFTRPIATTDFVDGDAWRSSLRFAVHAQGAAPEVGALCGATSSKAAWDATGAPLPGAGDARPAGCGDGGTLTGAVVPEPATLVLAATGMAGIGLVARRRRRG